MIANYLRLSKTMMKGGINTAQVSYENSMLPNKKETQVENDFQILEALSPETLKHISDRILQATEEGFFETDYTFCRDIEGEDVLFTQYGVNIESINTLILAFNILGYKTEFTLNTHRDKLKFRIIWHLY